LASLEKMSSKTMTILDMLLIKFLAILSLLSIISLFPATKKLCALSEAGVKSFFFFFFVVFPIIC